jgi:hypothetical protein
MRPFGIIELVRTGRIAMVRGICRPDTGAATHTADASNTPVDNDASSLA